MKLLSQEITSQKINCALKIQDNPQNLPPLSVGEVVTAEILDTSRSGNVPILLKNKKAMVHCKLPLEKGEKVTVKVAQLHPKVILRIVSDAISRDANLMNCLRLFRSNPKMLFTLFNEAHARFSPDNTDALETFIGTEDIRQIKDMITSLTFSRKSAENPYFFRDFVHKLGYMVEQELGEALKNKSGRTLSVKSAGKNLKTLFQKISDGFQGQPLRGDFPAAEKLSEFVRLALSAIETHQGINYLLQEQEGKYMFQIPLMFPENMGMAEIFVKFNDRESSEKRDHKKKSVLICLDMDAMGPIVVETVIDKKKMGCTLKCKDRNVADFIKPFLVKLGQKLEDLGYKLDHLECRVEADTLQKEHVSDELHPLFAQDKVDVMV
jgi:hypothetical protein